jgi:site-specific DNA-methyltransferase (adenine-specific)
LILTDPPYYSTDLAFDKAEKLDFKAWLLECKRLLKPNGVLVSFCDLNLLIELRSHKVFKTAYEVIWHKTMAVGFLDANTRPLRSHEFILVCTNELNNSTYNAQKWQSGIKRQSQGGYMPAHYSNTKTTAYKSDGERHPTSVLNFSNGNNNSLHPTQKPLDLVSWLIRTYSNKNDLILDPFMGSGTTGHAASLLNRHFIGCELDPTYYAIAKSRIEESQHDLVNYVGVVA